jgi:hypothetical protein
MVLSALLVAVLMASVGCTAASAKPEAAAPAPGRTVRVTASQFGSPVSVRVGDVLKVERPADYEGWTVDFSRAVLRSLNTDEGRRTPPADGWTFAVVGSGTTELVLSAQSPRGPTAPRRRFVLSIVAE